MLIDNSQLDRDINGNKAAFRFVTPREQMRLMGFEFDDFDTLNNAGFDKGHIETLAGNSIVVSKLEAIFSAIIKRDFIKNRIKKAVATKTKKMNARVLETIEKLRKDNQKLNPYRVSKVAKISYPTTRKYWKLLNISKKITQKEIFENIKFELLKRCGHVRVIFTKDFSKYEIFTNRERYLDESKFDLEDELILNNAWQEYTKTGIKKAIRDFFNTHYSDSFNYLNY